MTAEINQKEYLKKYLSMGKAPGDKKKKKKKKLPNENNRTKIIDDDAEAIISGPIVNVDDVIFEDEDAPQIVAIIDERPKALQFDEKTQNPLWQPIGTATDYEVKTVQTEKQMISGFKIAPKPVSAEGFICEVPPSKVKREERSEHEDNSPPRRRSQKLDTDSSPPRKRTRDRSPPRRRRDRNSSLSRRSRDRDNSPRGDRERVAPGRRNEDGDGSPPRRKERDSSPPRRKEKDSSPPRRKERDSSPPRRKERDSSPPRRKDRDSSPPRSSRDNCPRGRSGGNRDRVTPRRRNEDGDSSPPRRKERNSSPPRSQEWDSSPPRRRHEETLTGKRNERRDKDSEDGSLLQTRNEVSERKERHQSKFSRWNKEDSPSRPKDRDNIPSQVPQTELNTEAAPTVVHHRKTGRRRDLDEKEERRKEKQLEEERQKEKYTRWGRGLAQIQNREQQLQDEMREMNKPLARYADDEDLERYLKEQEREGDPMLAYIRSKKRKIAADEGQIEKPQFEGNFMPNRYGIKPGHRWDGVDRSNGYEKRWFEVQNSKSAIQEDVYKWSTEDM